MGTNGDSGHLRETQHCCHYHVGSCGRETVQDVITHYRLVIKDITSGRRRPIEGREPIRGRYPAEAERDRLQRQNRDPQLQYELERTTAPQTNDAGNESGLFDHHFRDRKW